MICEVHPARFGSMDSMKPKRREEPGDNQFRIEESKKASNQVMKGQILQQTILRLIRHSQCLFHLTLSPVRCHKCTVSHEKIREARSARLELFQTALSGARFSPSHASSLDKSWSIKTPVLNSHTPSPPPFHLSVSRIETPCGNLSNLGRPTAPSKLQTTCSTSMAAWDSRLK